MQISRAVNNRLLISCLVVLVVMMMMVMIIECHDDEQDEAFFIDCSHLTNCLCGKPMVIGHDCTCPQCPQVVSFDQEEAYRITHPPPKNLDEIIKNQQVEHKVVDSDQQTRRNLISSEYSEEITCSKECLYGGKRNNNGKCQCYCGENEMTPENQPLLSCDVICQNKFMMEIERNQYGCQSKCICSRNIAFENDFEQFKLDSRSMEDNCNFLERSIKKISQYECDEQCGKDVGGKLTPYMVVFRGKTLTCERINYCKCNMASNSDELKSNQSQCQRECNDRISHVEYSLTNTLNCHCKL